MCTSGLPLSILTGLGSQHDSEKFIDVMDNIKIKIKRGRPRTRPDEVVADAAYDDIEIRKYLRKRHIRSNISINKRNRKKPKVGRPTRMEKESYKTNRSCVEKFNSWIKTKFRRLTVRYEILESCFMGLLNIACFLMYWQKMQAGGILK